MKYVLCPLISLIGCVTRTKEPEPAPIVPLPAATRSFLDSPATLLASKVILRLQGNLYEEVTYRVDRNFHTFIEDRSLGKIVMTLKNQSGVINQAVKMWIGRLQIVATNRIEATFGEGQKGLWIQANGDIFWEKEGKVVQADRMSIRDGEIQFVGER